MAEVQAEFARTPPLRELVYTRLRERIVDGTLAPGEHLVEMELAAQLGVSRGPIREALQHLARDGWVDLRPRHGAYVHLPDVKEIDSFFSVRTLIECEAARLVAERVRSGEVSLEQDAPQGLGQLLGEARRTLARQDHDALADANSNFHAQVAELSGNEALRQVWDYISRRIRWYFAPLVKPRAAEAWVEHATIVEALSAGDAELAAERTRLHIDHTRQAYKQI
jgi:DNA-binding GntR family transcriptional regulator